MPEGTSAVAARPTPNINILVFTLLWTLANVVGGAMTIAAISEMFRVILVTEGPPGRDPLLGIMVCLAAFWTIPGGMQWLVLRRRLPRASWWVLASLGGMVGGMLVWGMVVGMVDGMLMLYGMGGIVFGMVGGMVFGMVGGAVFGSTQWLVLRQRLCRAGWWVLASALGGAVGWGVGGAVVATLLGGIGGAVDGAVFGAVFGLGYGLITGPVLAWLLRGLRVHYE